MNLGFGLVNYLEHCISLHKETVNFFGVIISVFTLFLAYRIKNQFGRSHLKTKQIDHVCDIIKTLNESKIEVTFKTAKNGSSTGTGFALQLNIFEIAKYDDIEPNGLNRKYEDEKVLFDSKSNQILDIKQYIDNPLTPRDIADELLKFHTSIAESIEAKMAAIKLENYVEIRTGIFNENFFLKETRPKLINGNAPCMNTWFDLKESAKYLKISIGNWLIENGINENNMREDFKTTI
jgi:hypothetical protein